MGQGSEPHRIGQGHTNSPLKWVLLILFVSTFILRINGTFKGERLTEKYYFRDTEEESGAI
jgi:hypothetical protein